MKLKSTPKYQGKGVHRVFPVEETYQRVLGSIDKIGITRITDITGLDFIGIPVYSAIVPTSNDVVSVYNGKGLRPLDAKVGAIMESLERFAAWTCWPPKISGSYNELQSKRLTIDPREIVVEIQEDFDNDTKIHWLEGFDLIQNEKILVPHYAAAYFNEAYDDCHLCYSVTSANGLASGNIMEEAVCHALCEVIERDAWTLSELASRSLPEYLRKIHPNLKEELAGDDLERYPSINLNSFSGLAGELIDTYKKAGVYPVLRNITSDLGTPTILCTISVDVHPTLSPAHAGIGTHPDAEVAAIRALTEAAQARAVDIQGLREDISMADEQVNKAFLHSKRVARVDGPNFFQTASKNPISFQDIVSYQNDNILDDINLMLDQLRKHGFKRAIVVDLSREDLPAKVIRVIVPGLESWAAVKGKVGLRAEQFLKDIAQERIQKASVLKISKKLKDAFFNNISGSKS